MSEHWRRLVAILDKEGVGPACLKRLSAILGLGLTAFSLQHDFHAACWAFNVLVEMMWNLNVYQSYPARTLT